VTTSPVRPAAPLPVGVQAGPRAGVLRGWRPRPRDAVALLTVYLVLDLFIPSPLVVGPLGAAGTPANLAGVALLAWWALSKIGNGTDIDRGRQPVRIALYLLLLSFLASVTAFFLRPSTGAELTGVARAVMAYAGLIGVALVAADGIASLARLHTLVRRVVHGVAAVAALGLVEFVTKVSPGQRWSFPGLVRNLELPEQARSSFLRVQSTALHPIELGSLLGLLLPVAAHYAFVAPAGWRRRLAWVEAAVIGAVLPMALSRTGVIVAIVATGAVALDWSWGRRARALVIVAAFAVAIRVAVPGLMGSLVSLFTHLFEDNSTTARTGRYEVAGEYFLEHPWFGRGPGTLFPATEQIFDNAYLYLAIENGAVGVAAILLLFIMLTATARGARRRSPDDPESRGLAQALAGTFVAVMVTFVTADMLSFSLVMGVIFLLAGVAGALWRLTLDGPAARVR